MGNMPRAGQANEVVSIQNSRPRRLITRNISKSPDIELKVHINKNSFKIGESKDSYYLTFIFDSLQVCLITIYYFGVEVLHKTEDYTLYFAVDTEKHPHPKTYKFSKGLNQNFPNKVSNIDLNACAVEIVEFESSNNYPIIVTIKPDSDDCYPYESSFIRLDKDKNS
jgi:hypothetical protein